MSVLLQICKPFETAAFQFPFAESPLRSDFSSSEVDFLETSIDLNQELVKNSDSTFYARVIENAEDSELAEGDILVVDRSLALQHGKIVVCFVEGVFTLKKVRREEGALWLETLNRPYDAVRLTADNYYMVWGLVTYTIKRAW